MDGGSSVSTGSEQNRAERLPLLAFIADAESEAVLREGLSQALPGGFEVRRGNVRAALQALSKMATPRVLIIDITGESQSLALLGDLTHVVEPDVQVMIVGEREDVAFYRQVTRTLGAAEYLYKPLVAEMVARHFGAQITRQTPSGGDALGGRMVTITGTRGGVGATTLAANLAWYLSQSSHRHTALLDPNLQTGTAAMLLGAQPGRGLRSALEQPSRVDELFIERTATPIADRLHILAGEEALTEPLSYSAGAAERMVMLLRRRFNFVVADVPFGETLIYRDLLELAHQRVLIMTPSLASIRDTLRLLSLPPGPAQARRAVIVINRAGMPGGLNRRQVEDALRMAVDVVISDQPRPLAHAESLGQPAAKVTGAFRNGIMDLAKQVTFAQEARDRPARKWPWRRS
jgi:pilus assembly protein CpaE